MHSLEEKWVGGQIVEEKRCGVLGWGGRRHSDGGVAIQTTERRDDVRLQFPPNTCTKANGINRVLARVYLLLFFFFFIFLLFFFSGHAYTYAYRYRNTRENNMQDCFCVFHPDPPVRPEIYSSITFRVSALSWKRSAPPYTRVYVILLCVSKNRE